MRMTRLPLAQVEEHLSHVTQQFAQWRASRTTPRGRIPNPLWAQAIALTQQLPLTRVAKQLGLTPHVLKWRGGEMGAAPGPTSLPRSPHFVEVQAPAWRTPTAEVEVQRADDTRLRITYSESAPALAPLLQHVVNHATHHRSEVATMITLASGSPPDTGINTYRTVVVKG